MISICEKQGVPTPKFEELGNFFRTTLYHGVSRLIEVEHWQKPIIGYLKIHKEMKPKKAQEIWRVTSRTTSTRLKAMCLQGILVEISTSSFDPHKKFILRN
jgi:predicted HTH transcriptional regulator